MLTPLGRRLRDSPRALVIAGLTGAVAILADLALVRWAIYAGGGQGRGVIPLIALAVYLPLVEGDLASVGLTVAPTQGWTYWLKATLAIGLLVGAFIVVGL